ncbi:MAG: hypothetical protein RLZZ187_1127 [Pseudomonadota bacterium]
MTASARVRAEPQAPKPRGEGAAPKSRATAPAPKRGAARPAKDEAGGPAWLARWWKVALLVALATIGLPFAHALFGEWTAMLGGAVLLGFLLGRWTAE